MATNFKLKRSAVASKRPGTTDLELGELALNTYDGFLYSETTGAGSTVSLLTPWQEKYGQDAIYYTGGSVGIGTTNSEAPFQVAGENSQGLVALFGRHDFIDDPRYNYRDATIGLLGQKAIGVSTGAGVQYTTRNLAATNWHHGYTTFDQLGRFHIGLGGFGTTSATDKITILSTGLVGIGTTVPATELDVNGDATFRTADGNNIVFDKSDNALKFGNDVEARFGSFQQFRIKQNATTGNSEIIHNRPQSLVLHSDKLDLRPYTNTAAVYLRANYNDGVDLYFANSKKFETIGVGVSVTGLTTTTSLAVSGIATFLGGASFLNNDVLYFGGSSSTGISTDYRLRIYSDGTDSYISEATGAGDLRLSSDSRVEIRNAALSHTVASFNTGVGVTVFDRFKVSGISSFTGDVDLGDATGDTITATGRFDSDLVPSTDVARDLGSSSLRWRTLYVSNLVVAPGGPGFAGSNITVNNLKVIGISTFLQHADFTSVSIGSTLNVAGVSTFNDDINIDADNKKLQIGESQDFSIYHDGNHSIINDSQGSLLVRSNVVQISTPAGSKYFKGQSGVTELYHSDSKKFSTTGAGVTVTGIITATTGHFDSITGPSSITIDPAAVGDNTGLVVIKGNLQVDGTTTTVNSTTLTVTDKNIEIAKGAGNDAAVDGAGITVDSSDGNKTWNWVDATNSWTSSEHIRVAADKHFGFANDPNTFIDGDGNDTINFTTNGTKRVSIVSNGNIGIGTTSPIDPGHQTLHIHESVSGEPVRIHMSTVGTGATAGDGFSLSVDGDNSGVNLVQRESADIRFYTAAGAHPISAEKMTIKSGGKVGIGSTDPQELMSIMANGPCGISILDSGHGQAATTIKVGNQGKDLSIVVPEDVQYTQTNGNYKITQNGHETFRITGSSGRVGIGTNNPDFTLTVRERTDANAFVNIKTSSATKDSGLALYNNNTAKWYIQNDASESHAFVIRGDGGSSDEFVTLTQTGNLGINSTTPDAKLSVAGIGTFKDDVYIDKKLYVSGIEIGGPGGPGIGTDITTRHLRATGITTTEQLLDADGGADIAGITTAALLDVGNLTNGRVAYVGSNSGRLVDSGNLTFNGSTLLVTGTLNSTVDVQINGTSVVDTALNDAVAMAIALG